MSDHRDTITGDARDEGGIASIGGGAAVASGGGAGALVGRPAATSGERADSLLIPDVAPPDSSPAHGDDAGGPFPSPDAGKGVTPA